MSVENRFPLYFLHKTSNIYNEQKWCLFGLIRWFYFLGNFFILTFSCRVILGIVNFPNICSDPIFLKDKIDLLLIKDDNALRINKLRVLLDSFNRTWINHGLLAYKESNQSDWIIFDNLHVQLSQSGAMSKCHEQVLQSVQCARQMHRYLWSCSISCLLAWLWKEIWQLSGRRNTNERF